MSYQTQHNPAPVPSTNMVELYDQVAGQIIWFVCRNGHVFHRRVPFPRELILTKVTDQFYNCLRCKTAKRLGMRRIHPEVTGAVEAAERMGSAPLGPTCQSLYWRKLHTDWRSALAVHQLLFKQSQSNAGTFMIKATHATTR